MSERQHLKRQLSKPAFSRDRRSMCYTEKRFVKDTSTVKNNRCTQKDGSERNLIGIMLKI